jgi:hypothetical protein
MTATPLKPIEYTIRSGFIKHKRELFGSLTLQIFQMPFTGLPFSFTTGAKA